ncbi:MAG: hypothetical protein NTZ22_10365 [Hyphomicrobiales bacterium]|nr:hypothetical protein [Hyphomicrobiales bacterium]
MMSKGREIADAIAISAIAYVVLFAIHHNLLAIFDMTARTAVFFISAAARVFCTLIFGYWAGAGIALGTIANSLFLAGTDQNNLYVWLLGLGAGAACSLSLLLWSMISRRVNGLVSPEIDFFSITWRDVLGFSVIQAVLNSSLTHTLFFMFPDYQIVVSAYLLAVMFVGDLSGAFLVFIASNLGFSFWLRVRMCC